MPPKEAGFLEPSQPLTPSSAAVALIIDEDDRYLMQLRDDIPSIFFPNHWGCFGGKIDLNETPEEALVRELDEELSITIPKSRLKLFTRIAYDASFINCDAVVRTYFEVNVTDAEIQRIVLQEGAEMQSIDGPELLTKSLVPFDHFAIWMHYYRLGFPCEVNLSN